MSSPNLGFEQSDNQSAVILEMERKLNPTSFWRRFRKQDQYTSITTIQYWDWLTYLDVIHIAFLIYKL